ncbi:glycosyltransferase [Garicola koreensis]|uniref:Glycosyltransferase family 1 protein n=1 Tax=Garicola koreensis TaxID=1262554 RepID=A0A7W5TTJ3_9MICC|nr:glycosyltransferase [Garicola koreensis]MBB3667243.1 hypothetical protein [Garicola koreensis]
MSRISDLRRRAGRIYRRATGSDVDALHAELSELAGEVSALSAKVQQLDPDPLEQTDVAILSDLRLPGGTTASIAEEVRAQSAAGMSSALIHAQSQTTKTMVGFSSHIQKVMTLDDVHIVSARARLHTSLLVIRHPRVIETAAAQFTGITAERVVIVANHPAVDAAGTWHYHVQQTDDRVRELFGVDPVWAPISPVVRQSLAAQQTAVRVAEQDWVNIFGTVPELAARSGFVAEVPVLGRHSRPQREKWPDTAEDLLAAYPDTGQRRVEILGGAEIPEQILGRLPEAWHVQPFGAEDPQRFLARVDFWVYMHHPQWREAFGRAIIEALAAGCVVVLPPYLRDIFADAAVYTEPAGVQTTVTEFWQSRQMFLEQSRRAQQFAAQFGPGTHLLRLKDYGVSDD